MSVNSIDHILKTNDIPIHLDIHEKKFWNKHYDNFSLHHGGDIVQLGKTNILCLHSPGHTPGSQCFSVNKNLVSGDTLFINGCGRVDLPGSDSDQMYHSLQHLCSLPDDTILYPGHHYSEEKSASLAETKSQNVYLNISDINRWRQIMG